MGPIRASRKRKSAEKKTDGEEVPAAVVQVVGGDWWDDFSRRITGPLSLTKEVNRFESIFKISRKTFNYISSLVREDTLEKPTHFSFSDGRSVSAEDLVAVAIRRLSSGDSLASVGTSFGLSHSSVAQVTWRFVEAMEKRGIHHLRWPNSEAEMDTIKSKFEKIRHLPNCCGVIDSTHIMLCLPAMDSKVWVDHEKNHSMLLQAVVDPDMRFRDVVTGWPGCMNELQVLQSSGLFKLCEKGERLNGKQTIPSKGLEVREYLIGDQSFPLLPWLVTPYEGNALSETEVEFNKRHFATRLVAQRALARLKDTWKFINGEMWMPDKHRLPRIILVCCLMQNIIIDLEDDVRDEMTLSRNHDSSYKQKFCKIGDKNGSILRNKLSQYLSGTQH